MSDYNSKKSSNNVFSLNKADGYLPPQQPELEEIILGSLLIDNSVIDKIMVEFTTNLFFVERNKFIAEAIIGLYKKNSPIDLVTMVTELKLNGKLQAVGGPAFISSLTSRVASAHNIEFHLRILQEAALKRNIIQVSSEAIRKCYSETDDAFDVLAEQQDNLEKSLKALVTYRIKSVGEVNHQIIRESFEVLSTGRKSGVETGLKMLDNVTNGFQNSDLIILAGRPSMGKTAAAISMCIYPAMILKTPIAIFSLEMSSEQLVARIQSSLSGVNVSKIVKKQMNIDEINTVERMSVGLEQTPLYIDDTPNISLMELKGKCRKLVKEDGVKMIVIDYLQLMRAGVKTSSREQEIAEISRGLKIIAKELKIPVIALSQLSRGVEARNDKKPMLQDLRESGQIEQDADMVMFCYRPEYYNISDYEVGGTSFQTDGLFMFIIAKHRNGELGEVPLRFIHEQTKLTNYHSNPIVEMSNKNHTFVQDKELPKQNPFSPISNDNDFEKNEDSDMPF